MKSSVANRNTTCQTVDIPVKNGPAVFLHTHTALLYLRSHGSMKASKASSIIFRVQEEENWMKTTSTTLTPQQINEIRALLFDSEPQDEILRIGDVMVDAEDLSTLAAERYIN